jgi:hypothetical protein
MSLRKYQLHAYWLARASLTRLLLKHPTMVIYQILTAGVLLIPAALFDFAISQDKIFVTSPIYLIELVIFTAVIIAMFCFAEKMLIGLFNTVPQHGYLRAREKSLIQQLLSELSLKLDGTKIISINPEIADAEGNPYIFGLIQQPQFWRDSPDQLWIPQTLDTIWDREIEKDSTLRAETERVIGKYKIPAAILFLHEKVVQNQFLLLEAQDISQVAFNELNILNSSEGMVALSENPVTLADYSRLSKDGIPAVEMEGFVDLPDSYYDALIPGLTLSDFDQKIVEQTQAREAAITIIAKAKSDADTINKNYGL